MLVLALRSLCGCLWLGAARVLAGPHQPSPPAASSNVLSSSGSAGGVLSAADGGVTTSPPQLADVSSDVTMSLLPGSSVNPYYFGFCLESYVGITMGLPLNDTAVMAIAKALHTGVLRYPGGTLSNLFDARTGRYVLPAPADLFPVGTPSCHAGTLGGGVIATQNTTTTSAMAWCNANPRCGGWTAKAACGTSDVVSVDFKDGWGATHHLQKPGYSFWLRGPKGGYPSGYDKWIPWGELTNKLPLGEYSARKYLQGLGSVTKRTIWCINVYSLNVSEACSQVEYIASLPNQQEPGVIIEFGNELYIGNQGDPRFPNGKVYMQEVQGVVSCTRRLMPHAKLIAVGAPGHWNQALRSSGLIHTFDGVSLHEYEPSGATVNASAKTLADRVSLVAGWGRAVMVNDRKQLQEDFGDSNHSIIYTEFGYGLNRKGQCVLPALLNGALHGAFHVSRILHAINTPGAFAAITLESFVGGRPEGYDPQAGGNRSDYWCGLAATTMNCPLDATGSPQCEHNAPDGARVTGEAQIFAHLASAAGIGGLSQAATLMHGIAIDSGPTLSFKILGEEQPCLQAAAFSSASPAPGAISIAALNICNQSFVATVKTAVAVRAGARRLASTASVTFYSLLDGGANNGWAPLPADNETDMFPWTSGPLHPTTHNILGPGGSNDEVRVTFPPLVFAMIQIKADRR